MFSFFTREVLEKVGYIDEQFYNAWEHVDHTYRIALAGYHPPFWWFADIADSEKYLEEAPGAIDNSSIADKKEQWHNIQYCTEQGTKFPQKGTWLGGSHLGSSPSLPLCAINRQL